MPSIPSSPMMPPHSAFSASSTRHFFAARRDDNAAELPAERVEKPIAERLPVEIPFARVEGGGSAHLALHRVEIDKAHALDAADLVDELTRQRAMKAAKTAAIVERQKACGDTRR